MADLVLTPFAPPPTQGGFDFPRSLTEKYIPRSLDEFAGLEKPKAILSKFAAAPYPSNWIFTGESGVGKTTMAMWLATAIRAEHHHIASRQCDLATVEEMCYQCQHYPWTGYQFHMIHVDEAHLMTPAARECFLSKLDDSPQKPHATVFVFTANSVEEFGATFLSRCRVVQFSSYGMAAEATALLERIWVSEAGADAPAPNFARIVKDSANNVRAAITRLELCLLEL